VLALFASGCVQETRKGRQGTKPQLEESLEALPSVHAADFSIWSEAPCEGLLCYGNRPCKTIILFDQMVCDAEEAKVAHVKKSMAAANGLARLKHCRLERDARGRGRKG